MRTDRAETRPSSEAVSMRPIVVRHLWKHYLPLRSVMIFCMLTNWKFCNECVCVWGGGWGRSNLRIAMALQIKLSTLTLSKHYTVENLTSLGVCQAKLNKSLKKSSRWINLLTRVQQTPRVLELNNFFLWWWRLRLPSKDLLTIVQ